MRRSVIENVFKGSLFQSMYILIYIVKFAKEIPSIQLLDDDEEEEDDVTQSSNETISKETSNSASEGLLLLEKVLFNLFFLNKVQKKGKRKCHAENRGLQIRVHILSMYMFKTANDVCC